MSEVGRPYDALAGDYDRHRPEYPQEIMLALREYIEAVEGSTPATVVDVGSGTGIATRLLRHSLGEGYRVIGLEPGEGMRWQARESTPPGLDITYIDATAEAMPFDDGSLAAVAVAQAVQWFDRPRFYEETCRVLRAHGTLAILQNNRDWRGVAFLDAYESFMETNNPAYNRNYRAFDIEAELRQVPQLGDVTIRTATWDRPMTVDAFHGMARSSSRIQQVIDIIGAERADAEIRALAGQYADSNGKVPVRYVSELYLARRKP